MLPKDFIKLSENQIIWLTLGLIAAIVLVTLVVWLVRYIKNTADDRRIEKIIKEQSEAYSRDIVISDGIYGYLFVDYLILLRGKIIAMDVQHLKGYIFGADQIEQWAQVVDNKSNKFKNPLYRVRLIGQQVNQLVKEADIEARVLFGAESSFPKGVPDGVLRMDTFKDELNNLAKNDYMHESMSKVWEELLGIAREHKQRYDLESKGG
ncbi:MAG: NERD domain-containing protein [Gammaproteobacteria bacterium]|nr:NERD domain-containing protein [Gammaproteobacteria bacterium]